MLSENCAMDRVQMHQNNMNWNLMVTNMFQTRNMLGQHMSKNLTYKQSIENGSIFDYLLLLLLSTVICA